MNFFTRKTTWSNIEFAPFKLCIASFYVIIGSYFHEFFSRYYIPLTIIFAVTLIWTLFMWVSKMRKGNKPRH
ncbi:hypothetical protein [Sporocytophaga myxococcoides]|uniref:hypothetical protein n=1 Tax=Sporocytophaga myxococcoides TaxID=153721 RepID=UPI0009E00717|nr:hypothetical protein [Sporocytophaga myxococcoides]